MQNKVLNEVVIEQMDDLIKAVKGGSTGFDADGTLPELQDGEVTDPLMAVGNDGKAKKLPVKTLFGKHNIRGSGNIDLYKHHIDIQGSSGDYELGKTSSVSVECFIEFYSSNSLPVDSLTDLKTLLGNTFIIMCSGLGWNKSTDSPISFVYMNENNIYFINDVSVYNSIPVSVLTFTDTVTTI